jgi:sortase (surface protein transpeptidase)
MRRHDTALERANKLHYIRSKKTHHLEKSLARSANKAILLMRVLEAKAIRHQKKSIKTQINQCFDKLIVRRVAFGLMASMILATTGYASFGTWQVFSQTRQVFAKSTPSSNSNDGVNKPTAQPKLPKSLDTKPPSDNALADYKVASDLPRAIYINGINVAARLMPMGVNSDNSLQAPKNIYDAGWYSASAKPGQPGAMLVDGHSSETGTHYGLFSYLSDLKNGDQIEIERGDGVGFTYTVVHAEIDSIDNVDMGKLLVPYGDAEQGVNLIACTGAWTSDNSTLDHRILVFATLNN